MATTKKPNLETRKGRRQFVSSDKWEAFVSKQSPGLLDIYRSNPDIAAIVRQGYVQERPTADIVKDIQATNWYRNLGAGEYEYITRTAVGDKAYMDSIAAREELVRSSAKTKGYELPDTAVKKIAADSLKGKWDTATISNAIGESVVAGAKGMAQPTAPEQAPTGLQKTADAAAIRSRAKRYGLNMTDSQIEGYVQSVLTGTMSDQQITDSFRNQAKALYPSVAAQLDAGDLETGVQAYKSIASQVLGIDASQVDFSQDKYKALLTYKDPANGESRLMNASEWGNYLRQLPDWKKTTEAQNRYQTMIDTIDRVFGKVR